MKTFNKLMFQYFGDVLTYEDKFVARFKYGTRDKDRFINFLSKHFTVDEYFELLKSMPPVKVLETKGYISSTVRKVLRDAGYPLTLEGREQYIKDNINKIK